MPNVALLQIEHRLTELACSPTELRRKIRELAEHHEDLKRDALEEGLSEAEAETRADELLGEPVVLADHLAASLRQSSWWGRHPIIGFCLLPPLTILPLLVFGMWIEYWLGRIYFTNEQLGSLADWENGLKYCRLTVACTHYAAIILAAVLFCTLARRRVGGFKWACLACVMCALHGAFCFVNVASHNFTVGYTNEMHWLTALLPLLIAFVIWARFRRAARRLAPLPAPISRPRSRPTVLPQIPKSGLVTPTSVITTLIFATIIVFAWRVHNVTTDHTDHAPAPKTVPINPSPTLKALAPASQ